jgi:hypothetical protein
VGALRKLKLEVDAVAAMDDDVARRVRKTPRWSRRWANFSVL